MDQQANNCNILLTQATQLNTVQTSKPLQLTHGYTASRRTAGWQRGWCTENNIDMAQCRGQRAYKKHSHAVQLDCNVEMPSPQLDSLPSFKRAEAGNVRLLAVQFWLTDVLADKSAQCNLAMAGAQL
jgi:hypothetical protein